jgi:LL-diaminopimelate aminotransferase
LTEQRKWVLNFIPSQNLQYDRLEDGFAVGNRNVIAGLGKIKSNLDSGVFQAIQEASVTALNTDDRILSGIRKTYQDRRDVLYEGLKGMGIEVDLPKASFYLWAKVPKQFDSSSFVAHILERAGVLTTPGNGFGSPGEGYSDSLTSREDR